MRLGENYREARETVSTLRDEYIDKFYNMSDAEFEKYKRDNVSRMGEDSLDLTKTEYANTIATKGADRAFAINYSNFAFDFMQLRALGNMWKGAASRGANSVLQTANEVEAAAAGSGLTGAARNAMANASRAKKFSRFMGKTLGMGKWGFANAGLAEWSEGIEEMVNEVGQREGQLYGHYLAGDADATAKYENGFGDRVSDYLTDPKTWDAAVWGALGGISFHYLGNAWQGFTNGKNEKQNQQQRLAEIANREQYWKNVKTNFATINAGTSPFEIETDANGNPVLDANGEKVLKRLTTEDEKNAARDKVINNAISELTLDAIESGNYNLLQDYLKDPKLKKALTDMGISTPEDYDKLNEQIGKVSKETYDSFIKYGSMFSNTDVSDAFMNVAIRNNVKADRIEKELEERVKKNNLSNDALVGASTTLQRIRNLGDVDTMMKNAYMHDLERELTTVLSEAKSDGAPQSAIDDFEKQLRAVRRVRQTYNETLGEETGLLSDVVNHRAQSLVLPDEIQQRYDQWKAKSGKDLLFGNPLAKYSTNAGVNDFSKNVSKKYVDNIIDTAYSEFERERNNIGRIHDIKELREREARMKKQVEDAAKDTQNKAINKIHGEFRKTGSRDAILNYMLTTDASLAPPVAGLDITRDVLKTKYGPEYAQKIRDAYDTAKATHPDPSGTTGSSAPPPTTAVPPVGTGSSGSSSTGGQEPASNSKADALIALIDELAGKRTYSDDENTSLKNLKKRANRIKQMIAGHMSQDAINKEYDAVEQLYKDTFKQLNGAPADPAGTTPDNPGGDPTGADVDENGIRNSRFRNNGETWADANARIKDMAEKHIARLRDLQDNNAGFVDDATNKEMEAYINILNSNMTKLNSADDLGDDTYSTVMNVINNISNSIGRLSDNIQRNRKNSGADSSDNGGSEQVKRSEYINSLRVLKTALKSPEVVAYGAAHPEMPYRHDTMVADVNSALSMLIQEPAADYDGIDRTINAVRDVLKSIDDELAKAPDSSSSPVEKVTPTTPTGKGDTPAGAGVDSVTKPDKLLSATRKIKDASTEHGSGVEGMVEDDFIGATINVIKPFTRNGNKFTSIEVMDDGFGTATIRGISSVGKVTELKVDQIQYLADNGFIEIELPETDTEEFSSTIKETLANVSARNKLLRDAIYDYIDALGKKPDTQGRVQLYFEDLIRYVYNLEGAQVVADTYDALRNMLYNIQEFEGNIILADRTDVLTMNVSEMFDRITKEKPVTVHTAGTSKGTMIQISMRPPESSNRLVREGDIKRYKTVMSLTAGDVVTVRKAVGELIVEKDGMILGTLPQVAVDEKGRFVKINENFKYVIDLSPDGVSYTNEFIDNLKQIVKSNSELLGLIESFKVYSERKQHEEMNAIFVKILLNREFGTLKKFMADTESQDAVFSSIQHLTKILSHYDNSAIDNGKDDTIKAVNASLDSWVNKLGNSYNETSVMLNNITEVPKKVKLGFVSSGRILKNVDAAGKPIYTNIRKSIRPEDSDNYQLYAVDEKGNVLHQPSGVAYDVNVRAEKGTTLMFIKDSSGRRVRVQTRNNTITHKYNEGTETSQQLAKSVLEPVSQAAEALLSRNYNLIDGLLENIMPYFSGPGVKGPTVFYGWAIVKTGGGWVINSRDRNAKIWFNYKGDHAKSPNIVVESATGRSFLEPTKEDNSNPVERSMSFFNKALPNVAEGVIFNTFLSNFRGKNTARDLDVNGKMWINDKNEVVYLLPNNQMINTGTSYENYMIDNNMLVTDVDAVRDAQGNILGNFVETSTIEDGNVVQSVNNDKNMHIIPEILKSTPEDKGEMSTKDEKPPKNFIGDQARLRDAIKRGTTLKEMISIIGQYDDAYSPFIELFDKLGITVAQKVGTGNAMATYEVTQRVMTIRNKFFTLSAGEQARTLLHELTHAYLHDGSNIEVLEGVRDIYKEFLKDLDNKTTELTPAEREYLEQFRYLKKSKNVALEEFFVSSLTNKSLIAVLNKMKYNNGTDADKGKSLLSKLLELVRDLFMNGFDITEGSMLDAINKTIGTVTKVAEEAKTVTTEPVKLNTEAVKEVPKEGKNRYAPIQDNDFLESSISEYDSNAFGSVASLRAAMPVGSVEEFDKMVAENQLSFVCKL
jgi:hypothetical protein